MDFLVSSNANALDISCYANALDDNHFSSNAGDAMRGRGESEYRENKSSIFAVIIFPVSMSRLTRFSTLDHLKWNGFKFASHGLWSEYIFRQHMHA